ncbi:hypothetical protein Ae201684_018464 [Aphanomyces euteiches]|uniref:Retroviral polymerase SH3-like domain-containing protein n=1 Tax=Aphanomyces euteiches TaxID=100861 RepID=A0A6G0W7C2_9STRA|nr:hypothetical protein Ae201684_018464 [Aphanomyces euteiches]
MNRTLIEMARTMMIHSNISTRWWAEAVNTAAFLRNRTPNSKTHGRTPHELLRGNVPKVANLKVFGCICYRRVDPKSKTDKRANKCIFIGYHEAKKAYKVYDLDENKVVFTVDVTFTETEFLHPRVQLVDVEGEPVKDSEGMPTPDQPFDEVDDEDEDMGRQNDSLTRPQRPINRDEPSASPTNSNRERNNPPFAHYPPRVIFENERDGPAA